MLLLFSQSLSSSDLTLTESSVPALLLLVKQAVNRFSLRLPLRKRRCPSWDRETAMLLLFSRSISTSPSVLELGLSTACRRPRWVNRRRTNRPKEPNALKAITKMQLTRNKTMRNCHDVTISISKVRKNRYLSRAPNMSGTCPVAYSYPVFDKNSSNYLSHMNYSSFFR